MRSPGKIKQCVLATLFISALNPAGATDYPAFIDILSFLVWGAVLGLTAILIGTLSDERALQLEQLYESHKTDTLKDALTQVANRRAFDYEIFVRTDPGRPPPCPWDLNQNNNMC